MSKNTGSPFSFRTYSKLLALATIPLKSIPSKSKPPLLGWNFSEKREIASSCFNLKLPTSYIFKVGSNGDWNGKRQVMKKTCM